MSVISLLQQRRAVRNLKPDTIEEEKIHALLEAAVLAPNDRLREPWHFYVVQGEAKERYESMAREFLEQRFPTKPNLVSESLKVVTATPLIIVVTSDVIADDEASSKDNEYAVACAIHSMWLAANELGLGLVWRTRGVGLVHDKRMYRFIGSPEHRRVVGTLFIGYPLEETPVTARTSHREKTTFMQ